MRRLGVFVATCGYIGYAPVAPGTFGSAVGLAVYAFVHMAGSPMVEIAAIVVLFGIGVWSADEAEQHFDKVDPGPAFQWDCLLEETSALLGNGRAASLPRRTRTLP